MRRLLALLWLALAAGNAAAADVKALDAVPGAQVWFVEDHSVPVIALTAALPAGSAYDPPDKAGLAALAAALIEHGAGSVEAKTFLSALSADAIRFKVVPGRDYIEISLLVQSEDAPAAFRLLGNALARPRFDAGTVAALRAEMRQSIEQARQDPQWIARNGLFSLYFSTHAYGHPVEGDPQGLAAIAPADLRSFAAGHWVRGGAKIALSGDVTAEEARTLLGIAFADLPGTAPKVPPVPSFVGAPGLHELPAEAAQPVAVFALPGLLRSDRDSLAGEIANLILGGGENARLGRELRSERGMTSDISTRLVVYDRAGIMIGELQAQPRDMRPALAAIREILRKFALEGPTVREFADAKLYLRGSFPLAFTSNADTAARLVALMESGRSIDYVARRNRLIESIGIEDVRRAARRLYASDSLTVVVVGKLPKAKASTNPYRR